MQIAGCTFDPHIEEIMGGLMIGSTVIMLHPHGNMDLAYLLQIIQHKQITSAIAVPSLLERLYVFINELNISLLKTIRTLCYTG